LLDVDKIRQLVEMMVANDLVEVSLRDGDVEVSLRRPNVESPPIPLPDPVVQASAPAAGPTPVQPTEAAPPAASAAASDDTDLVEITSPMVGTFYSASDPETPPFVAVGTEVHPGSVVCILEAMKVFNEIKAEISGTIERILVKNEQPVEYGQPLFAVRPL
jgi:acetyl-CoA carboxylase biotin carboxyl carrier protein